MSDCTSEKQQYGRSIDLSVFDGSQRSGSLVSAACRKIAVGIFFARVKARNSNTIHPNAYGGVF